MKEIFKTLQGEGYHTGTVAVFCRFTGCNLWSGREQDRAAASCTFCDTDFVGGTKFRSTEHLVATIEEMWGDSRPHRFVVLTGGEPLLQVDPPLLKLLRNQGFFIQVETNGTLDPLDGIDWLTVSPKGRAPLHPNVTPSEIKLVYPQVDRHPESVNLSGIRHKFLQPMDGQSGSVDQTIAYCASNPEWRLSLQTHKLVGIR